MINHYLELIKFFEKNTDSISESTFDPSSELERIYYQILGKEAESWEGCVASRAPSSELSLLLLISYCW